MKLLEWAAFLVRRGRDSRSAPDTVGEDYDLIVHVRTVRKQPSASHGERLPEKSNLFTL